MGESLSITDTNGKIIVEFEVNSVFGAGALGAYVLRFSINYSMPPHEEEVHYHKTAAKVYVGENDLYLGVAFPEQPKTFKPNIHSQKSGLLYEILVSKSAIEEIEKIRSGKNLAFRIDMSGEYNDGLNQLCASESLRYIANQNEWITALKSMNFKGGLVFELPMDISPIKEVKTALEAIDKAREHLYYGNYDDVVAKCRISLESIISNWGGMSSVNDKAKKNRKTMTKEQRFFNALNQIVHLTHLSHHPDENDEYVSFTRSEAVFVLGATVSAVSSYAENKI